MATVSCRVGNPLGDLPCGQKRPANVNRTAVGSTGWNTRSNTPSAGSPGSRLEGTRKLRLVILDACRNNPFKDMRRSAPSRAVGRGLSPVEPDAGTLVAFAAKTGSVASDGTGGSANSPYAAALVRNLQTPDGEVDFVFRLVREDVLRATGKQQDPAVYGSLPAQRFVFRPATGAAQIVTPSPVEPPPVAPLPVTPPPVAPPAVTSLFFDPPPAPPRAPYVVTPAFAEAPLKAFGVHLTNSDEEQHRKRGFRGVVVTHIDPKSSGTRSGLERGDVIVSIGMKDVSSVAEISTAVAAMINTDREYLYGDAYNYRSRIWHGIVFELKYLRP